MTILEAIVLAIIEGLTEFLPISSTGHMIIGASFMGIADKPFTKMFIVVIQLGAILSVVVLYWKRFLPEKNSLSHTLIFYLKLLVAFLPAATIGLIFGDRIDELLEHVDVVGYALVAGGIFFLFVDQIFKDNENQPDQSPSYWAALKIGFFQCLAMVPGVSRSAATIIGGLAEKLNKRTAAEFSFFLAVPTMLAATLYKSYKYFKVGGTFTSTEISALAVGNVVAFIVAILAIKSFIGFLTKHGFKVFGYYRILAGIVILVLYYLGVGLTIV